MSMVVSCFSWYEYISINYFVMSHSGSLLCLVFKIYISVCISAVLGHASSLSIFISLCCFWALHVLRVLIYSLWAAWKYYINVNLGMDTGALEQHKSDMMMWLWPSCTSINQCASQASLLNKTEYFELKTALFMLFLGFHLNISQKYIFFAGCPL